MADWLRFAWIRKKYAKETSGGYYAARLPIVEKLQNMKRKGNVLVFRFITEEYSVPLGVWVVREATRKALKDKGLCFGGKELMLEYSKEFSCMGCDCPCGFYFIQFIPE